MPTYDYKCEEHGYFEKAQVPMADCRKDQPCPECNKYSKKVILTAPQPMIEAMADAGCPGAFMTSGDRLEKRHRDAGQQHTASQNQRAAEKSRDHELQRAAEISSK